MRFNFKRPNKNRMVMCRFTDEVHAELKRIASKKKLSLNEVVFVLVEGALDDIKKHPELLLPM